LKRVVRERRGTVKMISPYTLSVQVGGGNVIASALRKKRFALEKRVFTFR
jgi:hypothetical protein